MSQEYAVACYYFPNYHVDPRNEAVHGPAWTEGSYLEPDTVSGMAYLEGMRDVFGERRLGLVDQNDVKH